MSTQPKYYLARNQQTFGPLSEEQIDALRQSGQLPQYTWIFREGDAEWMPTDPAPALPAAAAQTATSPAPTRLVEQQPRMQMQPQSQQPRLRSVPQARKLERDLYRVILFDHRNAISGWLEIANDGGCVIRSDVKGADPLFVARGVACLTLHDTRGGQSIKLRVNVAEIGRSERGWSYQLQWNELPAILNRVSERSEASVAA